MRRLQTFFLVSSLSLLVPLLANAQSIHELQALSPEDRRAYLESMSDDERQAMRQKWRSEFENLPDADKQAMRERWTENRQNRGPRRNREAMRERWNSMNDEERAVAKERRQTRIAERRERWNAMSDDERAAVRAKRDERRDLRREHKHRQNKQHETGAPVGDQP